MKAFAKWFLIVACVLAIVLGIGIMSAFVVILNRLLWRPLYRWAEIRFRLD